MTALYHRRSTTFLLLFNLEELAFRAQIDRLLGAVRVLVRRRLLLLFKLKTLIFYLQATGVHMMMMPHILLLLQRTYILHSRTTLSFVLGHIWRFLDFWRPFYFLVYLVIFGEILGQLGLFARTTLRFGHFWRVCRLVRFVREFVVGVAGSRRSILGQVLRFVALLRPQKLVLDTQVETLVQKGGVQDLLARILKLWNGRHRPRDTQPRVFDLFRQLDLRFVFIQRLFYFIWVRFDWDLTAIFIYIWLTSLIINIWCRFVPLMRFVHMMLPRNILFYFFVFIFDSLLRLILFCYKCRPFNSFFFLFEKIKRIQRVLISLIWVPLLWGPLND